MLPYADAMVNSLQQTKQGSKRFTIHTAPSMETPLMAFMALFACTLKVHADLPANAASKCRHMLHAGMTLSTEFEVSVKNCDR